MYVAKPELLASAGVDAADVAPNVDVLTAERGALYVGAGKVFAGTAGGSVTSDAAGGEGTTTQTATRVERQRPSFARGQQFGAQVTHGAS